MKQMRNPDCEMVPTKQALAEWDELTAPMRALGFTVNCYDPGVRFNSILPGARGPELNTHDLRILNEALLKQINETRT